MLFVSRFLKDKFAISGFVISASCGYIFIIPLSFTQPSFPSQLTLIQTSSLALMFSL
jgi:hypothetical protein